MTDQPPNYSNSQNNLNQQTYPSLPPKDQNQPHYGQQY